MVGLKWCMRTALHLGRCVVYGIYVATKLLSIHDMASTNEFMLKGQLPTANH